MKFLSKGDMLLLLAAVIWGLSFPLLRNLSLEIGILNIVPMRFIIAAVFLILFYSKKIKTFNKRDILAGLLNALILMCAFYTLAYGQTLTTAINSSFIIGLNLVAVPLLSVIMLKKKPSVKLIGAIIIALTGTVILSGGLSMSFNIGDMFAFVSMLFYSIHIIVSDRFISRGVQPLSLGVMQIVWAAVLNIPVLFVAGVKKELFQPVVLIQVLLLGVICTAVAFILLILAQKDVTPSKVSILLGAEPVSGGLFSALIPDFWSQSSDRQSFHYACYNFCGGQTEVKKGNIYREGYFIVKSFLF